MFYLRLFPPPPQAENSRFTPKVTMRWRCAWAAEFPWIAIT
jgi:hypothetical protein